MSSHEECLTLVTKPTKSLNFKNKWELDLSALEAIEMNDELIQPAEDELEPDRAWKFDTSILGSLEQAPQSVTSFAKLQIRLLDLLLQG